MLNDADKELYVSRIISGVIKLRIKDKNFYISVPRPHDQVEAQEIYIRLVREAEFEGVFTDDELLSHLKSLGLWSKSEEEKVEKLPKAIDDLKVALFQSENDEKRNKGIRMSLNKSKDKFAKLISKKVSLLTASSSGVSEVMKTQYLIYTSAVDKNNKFLFDGENFWNEDFNFVEKLYSAYSQNLLGESVLREIARTDPWRSIWNASKSENSVFGLPAVHLSKEQKTLTNWSRFYDSIYESMDVPSDKVVQDDDMLDGWVIHQSRKREADKFKQAMEEKASKHGGAGEVGIVVGSREEADKIYDHNHPMARRKIRSRQNTLVKRGNKTIREQDLPDSKREIAMQAVRETKKKR